MKKKFIFFATIFSFLALSGCSTDNATIEVESLPIYNYNDYYQLKNNTLDTYYIDSSNVPYVSVDGYIKAMDGMLDASKYSFSSNSLFREYVVKTNLENIPVSIIFDYGKDKILCLYDYVFQNTVDITDTIDYSFNLDGSASDYYSGRTIIFELAEYNFDMRYINGNCLVPFQIMNALFGGLNYDSMYYTGNAYYNTYFSLRYIDDYQSIFSDMKSNVNSIIDDEELRESNYNFICFYIDYFYGLKEEKNFEKFDDYLTDEIKQNLKSNDPLEYEAGYAQIVQKLNECHTSIHNYSYNYNGSSISFTEGDYAASNFVSLYSARENLLPKAKEHYGNDLSNSIEIEGDTCYIFFSNFETGDTKDVKDENNNILSTAYLYDTYYLFYKAFAEIEKSPTKINNIVVDLSVNGGGNAGAEYRALGFVCGSYLIGNRNSLSKIAVSYEYRTDTNNDGLYNIDDGYDDYNWYILTSPSTYSAANLFTHYSKINNSNVKVIGKKAGGGGCSILPLVMIDGTTLQISGINQNVSISSKGTSYSHIILENGPEVDYNLDYEYFYDRVYLNNFISNLK